MVIRAQISHRSPGRSSFGWDVHVAISKGGERRAVILCMIAANGVRGIATLAI
jgi:hypothetical protein